MDQARPAKVEMDWAKVEKVKSVLKVLVDLVVQMDPGVRDTVLIGSCTIFPDLALDYDLVVTTTSQDNQELHDALERAADKPVDLFVRRPGDVIEFEHALAIGAGCILWGTEDTHNEAEYYFQQGGGTKAAFNMALGHIKEAEESFERAQALEEMEVEEEPPRPPEPKH